MSRQEGGGWILRGVIDGARVLAGVDIPAGLAGRDDVWLVGGAVRDVLLGREPRELDFVVEGDAVALARELGDVRAVHERFGTAATGVADLAGARRESYPAPGALPEVELGATVAEDLARRDFTVNAIAVRLSDGRVEQHPGAEDDLEARVLRVLHDGSFADDPTRLIRLARYAARLGFQPDPHTERLAAAARVGTVTPTRLGEELRLLLGEPLPEALERLPHAGDIVHPSFDPDAGRVSAVLELCPDGLAALAACLVDAPAGELRERLDALGFPAGERETVTAAATRAADLGARLRALAGGPASGIWGACRRERGHTVALAGVLGGPAARDAAQRWLTELRDARLEIDGHDLVAAGLRGEAVGEALDRAMRAALDGEARTREEQLQAALASEG